MTSKSWIEKLNAAKPHDVKRVPRDMVGMKAGEMMLLPSPRLIDEFIRALPKGRGMDVKTLRKSLAMQHGADVTCPIVTGFHLRVVAEAAHEAYRAGARLRDITPFWRVLDKDAPTTQKLSFGAGFVLKQRRLEGLA